MNKNNNKQHIISIIGLTFKEVDRCFTNNQEAKHSAKYMEGGSRLLFPCYSRAYRNARTRISEQELRFIFIEQFTQYCNNPDNHWNAFYSVETPTEFKYRFSESVKPERDDSGRSAMMDVCIYDEKGNRLCLIEFKAGNPDGFCYVKDFVKLSEEIAYKQDVPESIKPKEIDKFKGQEPLRFFVHILEKSSPDIQKRIIDYCVKDNRFSQEEMEEMVKDIHFVRHYIEGETIECDGKAFFAESEWR